MTKLTNDKVYFSAAINKALEEILASDSSVILLGEDIGVYGGAFGVTRGLQAKFGAKRVIDMPISELGFTGMAVGMALKGFKPIVEIMFMDFLLLALDPIVNKAVKIPWLKNGEEDIKMVIRTAAGGGRCYGQDHSQSFEALLNHIPGINIFYPACADEAYSLLLKSIEMQGVTVFIESKALYPVRFQFSGNKNASTPGKAKISRKGKDITLISYGRMLYETLKASQILKNAEGIECEVINLVTLAPLDIETILKSIEKTHRVAIIEETWPNCGVAANITAQIVQGENFYNLDMPPIIISPENTPIPFAKNLEKNHFPNAESISKKILQYWEKYNA